MRLVDYNFVFDGWDFACGYIHIHYGFKLDTHNGLPYVNFWVIRDDNVAVVRCDPCSLDQDQGAYAAMVRMDLEHEIAKVRAKATS